MVFLAKDIVSQQPVAIKCMIKPGSPAANESDLSVDELSQELLYHDQLGTHPSIVNLLDSFETENHTFLVLEFCPMGDLYEAIRLGRGPLETEHVRYFMLQLVAAVEHMHSRGVYHRDIKPENIFLSQDGDVKLGDFGLATTEQWTEENAVGSDRYMAPEQYDAFGGYSPEQADIWAIGICLLNILFARNPFVTPTESDPLFADYVLDRESLFDIFPTLSIDTFEVLVHCLALDPTKRSLAAVREAIERVVSWTTDDESLDEFCTEDRDVVAASANREPLRTPSLLPPPANHVFPWAEALHMSPGLRQLSAIHESKEAPAIHYSEEMFRNKPDEYARDMGYFVPHPSSFDSGLGSSFPSLPNKVPEGFALRSSKIAIKKAPPATNLDNSFDSAFANSFGSCSKSWSDWVIEDEEEEEREREERDKELKRRSWSNEPNVTFGDDDGYDVEWVGGGWEDLTV
jgi:serine/threonine protein kinase